MQKLKSFLSQQTGLTDKQWQLAHDAKDGIISYLIETLGFNSQYLATQIAEQYQQTLVNLEEHSIREQVLPLDLLKKMHAIVLNMDDYCHLAISDPLQFEKIKALQFITEKPIKTYISDHRQIKTLLNNLEKNEHIKQINDTTEKPLINLLDHIITHAIEKQATDIHIEHYQQIARVRFRIDGLLQTIDEPAIYIIERLNTRIKVISQLDISEKHLPQDGYCAFNGINIRVSTCPTIYGEKIVLRLLPAEKIWKIDDLNMSASQKQLFIESIQQAQGLVLVTGPTGSGKTVTLYSALQYLLSDQKNICTVEDPVEIRLFGVNQVSINHKKQLYFSTALKTFLRQDPDIIMIGEIRDTETAQIAMRAAQTGHLVLATLHTNSAADTIGRLMNLGIPPYEIASQVTLITAQRLLRKKKGQDYCGRFAVHELLKINEEIAEAICEKQNLKPLLTRQSFSSLRDQALNAVKMGLTTQEEVERVLGMS